jgi:hypothetical protein
VTTNRRIAHVQQLIDLAPEGPSHRAPRYIVSENMKIQRSIGEPIRPTDSWEARWKGVDEGLIACWERGREKALEDPEFASRAQGGQLAILPWNGGVEKVTKKGAKYGTFFYLAMWQGL